jgi:ABC-type branched-subunit amino acid transport system ATPase component
VSLLSCESIDLSYGQVQILFGVDFDVDEGEMVALLGTNGAGKSTLLRAICSTAKVSGGRITFDGEDITNVGPLEAAARGIVQAPGGKGVFPSMSVGENLRVASWLYRRDPAHVEAAVGKVLEMFPILGRRWDQPAGNLSGGEQQMLTLAQAFVARPRLLLIDELSLGLAPTIIQQLLDVVRAIHAEGVTVVLVEQSVNVALTVCQRAVFLEKGEVRFGGPTAELLDRPDVLRSVFLEGAASKAPSTPSKTNGAAVQGRTRVDVAQLDRMGVRLPVLLEARSLTKRFGGITAVDGVSFALHQGEILGLIGSNGAGKTTIFDLLSGFLSPDEGAVLLDGEDVTTWPADARSRARLGRSFQDARLFPSLTVAEVIAVALERHLDAKDALSAILRSPAVLDAEAWVARRVDELVELMGLGAFRDKFVSELSTGSRRIVDIACSLAHEPKVLLLDEPSSGIAQRETEALGPLLLRIQQELGTSLLVIEHDMPLISSIADRLVALESGAEIASGTPEEVLADPRVVASYLGTDERTIARSGSAHARANGNGRRRRARPLTADRGETP